MHKQLSLDYTCHKENQILIKETRKSEKEHNQINITHTYTTIENLFIFYLYSFSHHTNII